MTRIDITMDDAKKRVITEAAKLAGQTTSQYIMSLVWPDAARRTATTRRIVLSGCDWAAFSEKLDAAPRNLPELKALIERESRFADA